MGPWQTVARRLMEPEQLYTPVVGSVSMAVLTYELRYPIPHLAVSVITAAHTIHIPVCQCAVGVHKIAARGLPALAGSGIVPLFFARYRTIVLY